MMIDGLKARGYEIVPVSDLLGKTRAEVMPPISTNERWAAWIDGLSFGMFGFVSSFIIFVFFVGDVLMSGRLVLVGTLAIYDRFHRRKSKLRPQLSAAGCCADPGLQRSESYRAHGALGAGFRLQEPARHCDRRRLERRDAGSHARRLPEGNCCRTSYRVDQVELRQSRCAQLRTRASDGRAVRGHRRRHPGCARCDLETGAALQQSAGGRHGGQCQGRQPGESVDALAGPGVHHQPELRAARTEHAQRGQRGSGRHWRMAHGSRFARPAATSTTPSPKMPISPWRFCRPAIG